MNILFIAPIFFDYEKIIKKILSSRYENVVFRSEVPFNSSVLFYALRRLSPKLAEKSLDIYAKQLLQVVDRDKIDKIFIIRGYGIRAEFLTLVREIFPQIEIINYQWDSLHNNPNGLILSQYAHKNYSFDLSDVVNNPQFIHLPLFYTWESLGDNRVLPDRFEKDIELLFVGGYHSKRLEIIELARKECERQGFKMVSHLYLPWGSYLRDRLTTKEIDRRNVSFKKISRTKYYELLCRTQMVLDIQSATQTGATIRTFETLSVGRKLISTNKMLKNEKFFSPSNIKIWTPDEPLDIEDLLKTPFDNSENNEILNINQWLERIGI